MHDHRLTCTFCKRSEDQVHKLVAGPGVYICDRCTDQAHAIIHEDPQHPPAVGLWRRLAARIRHAGDDRAGDLGLRRAHSV